MVQFHSLGSQSLILKRDNSYTSGYGKVQSRIWNVTEGFSACMGDHNTKPLLSTIIHLVPQSLRTIFVSSLCEKLAWKICCSETPPCHQGAPSTYHSMPVQAAQEQMVLKRLLVISPLSWLGEGILQEPV